MNNFWTVSFPYSFFGVTVIRRPPETQKTVSYYLGKNNDLFEVAAYILTLNNKEDRDQI